MVSAPRFRRFPDLASERLGGRALLANDEFFAPKENLLRADPPIFDPQRYTDRGKWMDGWETRRRRDPGHDWVVVRLGVPGMVHGIVVDTTHFRGNHPERASLEACALASDESIDFATARVPWRTLIAPAPLAPHAENELPVDDPNVWTHLRLSIHPDGGVARLRVHGEPAPDWDRLATKSPVDLAAAAHGGLVLMASDEFFGSPGSLLLPGPPQGMWDGWETRRRRGAGHDSVIVRLGRRGRIVRVGIDTRWFKGNAPASAAVDVLDANDLPMLDSPGADAAWNEFLAPTGLRPDVEQIFEPPAFEPRPATHARLRIYPDGGVARLRLWGEVLP